MVMNDRVCGAGHKDAELLPLSLGPRLHPCEMEITTLAPVSSWAGSLGEFISTPASCFPFMKQGCGPEQSQKHPWALRSFQLHAAGSAAGSPGLGLGLDTRLHALKLSYQMIFTRQAKPATFSNQ